MTPPEVYHTGTPLQGAAGVVVLLHGRGASAYDILSLAPALSDRTDIAFLAPQAEGHTWYPLSFLAPREENEPKLSRAIETIEHVMAMAMAAGIATEKIALGGFSQGACLTSEYLATHPARYAAGLAFTGGLIGPLGMELVHAGSLQGTPVLLASGDPDPHVPWSRVEETAATLTAMEAQVTLRRYPGRPHTVSAEEIEIARGMLATAF